MGRVPLQAICQNPVMTRYCMTETSQITEYRNIYRSVVMYSFLIVSQSFFI
jgi:hypothetical protein